MNLYFGNGRHLNISQCSIIGRSQKWAGLKSWILIFWGTFFCNSAVLKPWMFHSDNPNLAVTQLGVTWHLRACLTGPGDLPWDDHVPNFHKIRKRMTEQMPVFCYTQNPTWGGGRGWHRAPSPWRGLRAEHQSTWPLIVIWVGGGGF